jgi:predicted amidohydrolase YtcJ
MGAETDLVFVNGRVVTVDAGFTVASALAVRGDRIVAVGDGDAAGSWVGGGTRVVDLRGGTLLSGINDSHFHAFMFGYNAPPLRLDVGYPAVRSIADVAESVRTAAASAPPGEWIIGAGWDPGYLDECRADPSRQPTRQDLDAASPGNPVFLSDMSNHTAWVNSVALRRAGIGAATVPPPGSVIYRDEAGEPAGLLNEGAVDLVAAVLPPVTNQQRTQAVMSAVSQVSALGVTSFTEPGIGPAGDSGVAGAAAWDVLRDLAGTGQLRARVSVLLLPAGTPASFEAFRAGLNQLALAPAPDPRMLNIIGVKILADGVPPQKTAWMSQEYAGGGFGALCVAGETDQERAAELRQMIIHAHAAGYQVGVHASGDRTIDTVVGAFADAVRAVPRPDPRHCVIHGDSITPASLAICAEMGFGINMNPTIKWTVADMIEEFLGPHRAAREWPYREAIDAGVTVASGSDAPVTYPDWRQGVATMILRESKASGRVSGADQRITLAEALRTYTINGAWQDFAEDWKGSLEAGKVADLCVLDRDLLSTDPHEIPTARVLMTVLGGQIIHDNTDAA